MTTYPTSGISEDSQDHAAQRRPVRRGQLLLGVASIVVAVVVAVLTLTGLNESIPDLRAWQWMLALGTVCVVLGGLGLIRRHRRNGTP